MADKTTPETGSKVIEKAQKLLALAQDESNEAESRNAAIQLARMMSKEDLQIVSGVEMREAEKIVKAAKEASTKAREEKVQNIFLGGIIGYMLKGKL